MILQIAFDRMLDVSESLIRPYVYDPLVRFEFGTPIIAEFGYSNVRRQFDYIPVGKIYVDTKTIDFHEREVAGLRGQGFRLCSFLMGSEHKALRAIACSPLFSEMEIWISTMGVPLRYLHEEALAVSQLGYTHFIAHGHGIDLTDAFDDMMRRHDVLRAISNSRVILAGGITLDRMDRIMPLKPDAIIVGRGITEMTSPLLALKDFRKCLL